ncbi:MAG: DUF805 domain-containing protein [Litorimonas sp.]
MPNILKLLFSPSGRIGRRDYLIGLVLFCVITILFNLTLKSLGNSMAAFWLSLPFPFLVLHMTYSVYGKRLHDMGRSFWPVTAFIAGLIAIAIIVMMTFGGAEYFAGFAEYGRDNPPPPELAEQLQTEYQARLAEGSGWLYGSMCSLIGVFSLWLTIGKPDPNQNRYGPPIAS